MVLLTAPLIADLVVCIAGNLRRTRAPRTARAAAVRLAVVVPAHDEELMIARTVQSLLAAGCSANVAHPAGETAAAVWETFQFSLWRITARMQPRRQPQTPARA